MTARQVQTATQVEATAMRVLKQQCGAQNTAMRVKTATQVGATAVRVHVARLWESLTIDSNGVASPSVVNAKSRSSGVGICCQVIWESIFGC